MCTDSHVLTLVLILHIQPHTTSLLLSPITQFMATSPSKNRSGAATLPPQRGRIKTQIFESLSGTVSHVASKAGEALSKIRGGGGGSTSTAASSPGRGYDSDGCSA
ncbi:hypothetical protein ACS0TY_014708 [Phlomoides rotata]